MTPEKQIGITPLSKSFVRRVDEYEAEAAQHLLMGQVTAAHRKDAAARALRQMADELLGPLWYTAVSAPVLSEGGES